MDLDALAEEYGRRGVVRIRQLFSPAETAELRDAVEQYRVNRLPSLPSADYTLEPDGCTVRNLWRMHEHDPFFRALPERPELQALAARLVNGDPVVMGVETFNKPARVGSAVPDDQDNAYFCQSPPDVLTLWIALDPATVENGAVEYLVGTHHALRRHTPSGVKGNSFGLAEPPRDAGELFSGLLEAGDALVHHCQTIHRSAPNRSDRSRLGLVIVYRGSHTRTDPDLESAYRTALSLTPQNA